MSFQFLMSPAVSRTKYKKKLNLNFSTENQKQTHWTNVEKVNNELFRLFYFCASEEVDVIDISFSCSHNTNDKNIKQQKIQKLKLREPVQQSNWMFDYFEEVDYNEKQQKKEKIQKLKLREPVQHSDWIDDYYI